MSDKTVLTAKCCFGHLGGTLGNRLFDRMAELGWLEPTEENPKHYALTESGIQEFMRLGVDPYCRRQSKFKGASGKDA